MSTKTVLVCDRCDKEININIEDCHKLKIRLDNYGDKSYDLCDDCAHDYWQAPLFKKGEVKREKKQFNTGVDDV